MVLLGDEREIGISKLGFGINLLRLTKGEFVHEELEFRCFPIKYSLEGETFAPEGIDLLPLWESDSSITGAMFQAGSPVFIHYYIDEIDDYTEIGGSVDELIDFLVDEYVEYEFEQEVRELLKS